MNKKDVSKAIEDINALTNESLILEKEQGNLVISKITDTLETKRLFSGTIWECSAFIKGFVHGMMIKT